MSEKKRQGALIDWVAAWVMIFGVWPLADPGHDGDTLLSVLDLALHVTATVVIVSRWKLTRRAPARRT